MEYIGDGGFTVQVNIFILSMSGVHIKKNTRRRRPCGKAEETPGFIVTL